MKIPALLLMLALVLSGCTNDDPSGADDQDQADPSETEGPADGSNGTAGVSGRPALDVTIDPVPANAPEVIAVSGNVGPGAIVVVRVVDDGTTVQEVDAAVDAGAWSAQVDVPLGQSVLEVVADDGTRTAHAALDLLRLGEMSFTVAFKGSLAEPRDDIVAIDPDGLTSAPLYEGCDIDHPGHFTVHDAMLQWAHGTDVEVAYGACGQFGFSVEAIDGHESPGFWCYAIDGEAAETGISTQAAAVGQTIHWDDCALVLG